MRKSTYRALRNNLLIFKHFVFQQKNVILSHKNLVRKLRANGDKVIQFFRFPEGYYVQTSDEMKILGTFSPTPQIPIIWFEEDKLSIFMHKLVSKL